MALFDALVAAGEFLFTELATAAVSRLMAIDIRFDVFGTVADANYNFEAGGAVPCVAVDGALVAAF